MCIRGTLCFFSDTCIRIVCAVRRSSGRCTTAVTTAGRSCAVHDRARWTSRTARSRQGPIPGIYPLVI